MRTKILALLLTCGGLQCAIGQQAGDSILTFNEAVDIALKNNVTLNQQRNNLTLSQVNKTFRIGQLGPQAGINASVGQRNGNSFIQQEGRVVNATVYGASAQLNVTMPIFNGLSGINQMRQADSQLDAQLAFVNRTKQDIINTVAAQYLQVLLDQELLKIAQENVELQKTILNQVKTQVELGARAAVDEYNQQAQVSNAELRMVQAEFTLVTDRVNLAQSLLLEPNQTTVIQEPEWDVNAIVMDNLSMDQLIEVAMNSRGDLKQAEYTEKASRHFMNSNKGNYLPSLNASYSNGSAWNMLKGADKTAPSYRNFNEQFLTDNRANYLGLNLYIPLFTGFQNRATYMQSKILYENNKLATQSRKVIVKGDVLRAYENFESIKKAYSAGLTGLEASQQAYNLEQERFNLGITSFVDFANANRTFIQAQTDMAAAKYRFLFQKIALDYAIGTLKTEDIPE